MNPEKILVIGDSWSSAYVATPTGPIDRDGWPKLLGVPDAMRQGVAGSTAEQWAADFESRLTKAAQTEANVVILSLLGNDAFAALSDGKITGNEIASALLNFNRVVLLAKKARTIVLQYADPFNGANPQHAFICHLMNALIKGECPDGVEVFDTRTVLKPEHFDGKDIHPNIDGHKAIAAGLIELLKIKEDK